MPSRLTFPGSRLRFGRTGSPDGPPLYLLPSACFVCIIVGFVVGGIISQTKQPRSFRHTFESGYIYSCVELDVLLRCRKYSPKTGGGTWRKRTQPGTSYRRIRASMDIQAFSSFSSTGLQGTANRGLACREHPGAFSPRGLRFHPSA